MNVEARSPPKTASQSQKGDPESDLAGEAWLEEAESQAEIQAEWESEGI